MTSPRELDFINTHTHLTGNRLNPWAILGSAASPQQHSPGTFSCKTLGVATTEPPTLQALKTAWRGFLYHSSLRHPRVLLLHPHCTFLPRAPDSSALQNDLCCFLLAVHDIKSFRDRVEPELPPPSLNPGSGRRSQWSACPDQHVPWSGIGPREAEPMWMAHEGALAF